MCHDYDYPMVWSLAMIPIQVSNLFPLFRLVIDEKESGKSSYDQDMIIWWCRKVDDYVLMGFVNTCYVFDYYVVRLWLFMKVDDDGSLCCWCSWCA